MSADLPEVGRRWEVLAQLLRAENAANDAENRRLSGFERFNGCSDCGGARMVNGAVRGHAPDCPRWAKGAEEGGWWRDHPAYQAVIDSFGRGVNNREHLAFLVLTGLRERGWDIAQSDENRTP